MCVGRPVGWVSPHENRGQRTTCWSWFSPSTMWVPGVKLTLSRLAGSSFPCWTMSYNSHALLFFFQNNQKGFYFYQLGMYTFGYMLVSAYILISHVTGPISDFCWSWVPHYKFIPVFGHPWLLGMPGRYPSFYLFCLVLFLFSFSSFSVYLKWMAFSHSLLRKYFNGSLFEFGKGSVSWPWSHDLVSADRGPTTLAFVWCILMMAFLEGIFGRRPKRQKGALGGLNKGGFSLIGQHV